MSILVSGAAGFVGSHIVDRLIERGAKVVAFDTLAEGRLENLERALPSRRLTFLYAAPDTGAFELRRLLLTAMDEPVEAVILARPQSAALEAAVLDFARTNQAAIVIAGGQEHGLADAAGTCRVRFDDVFGPRMTLESSDVLGGIFAATLEGRPFPINGIAEEPVRPTYVSDVVDAVISAMHERRHDEIVVACEAETSLGELCARLATLSNVPLTTCASDGATRARGAAAANGYRFESRIPLDTALRNTVRWLKTRTPSAVA